MRFENPQVRNDVNVSKEHPLKEFSQLLIGLLLIVVIAIIVLSVSVGYVAKKIPFSYEQKLVGHIESLHVTESPQQQQLQALADRLSVEMDLPDDMKIVVHYSDSDVVNAFATMGGHVFFFKGLIEKLSSENALAMVMAHEIAHVKHRHPIAAMGKGVVLATLASFVAGASGSRAGEVLIGESMTLGVLKFSRDQETQSDLSAMEAIYSLYGNVQGAEELFAVFSNLSHSRFGDAEIFRSHPLTGKRWERIRSIAEERGWPTSGLMKPLEFDF
ncbi:MAG: M48 family metallopeptidase [Arenicella sp.]